MVAAGFSLRLFAQLKSCDYHNPFAQVKTCGYQDNHSLNVKSVIIQINLSLAGSGCFLIKG